MTTFIWSICGCYWGASCCIPCGPLVGLPLQLPSPGSHPEEERKKNPSWNHSRKIQEVSWEWGPILCLAGSTGVLIAISWSLMPAGKTLCRPVVLSYCPSYCMQQATPYFAFYLAQVQVSSHTKMMWLSIQHWMHCSIYCLLISLNRQERKLQKAASVTFLLC